MNLFLFTCFFVSLQPIIALFAVLGMGMMYWSTKYSFFNRCQRPIPGANFINTAMVQMVSLGGLLYALGSFFWCSIFSDIHVSSTPNIVAIVIGGIIFMMPYNTIVKRFVEEIPEENLSFEKDRIFLPSEYDRLNPTTS